MTKMKIKRLLISMISLALSLIVMLGVAGCSGCSNSSGSVPKNDNAPATEIDLVRGGNTDYVIVIPEEASKHEQYAAEELALYVKEATSANLAIVNDSGKTFNQQDKVISVGETSIKDGSGVTVPFAQFKRDGFKIKRLGNTLILCGGGNYGTLYAVYEFLHQELDWEPYAVDEIYFRKTLNLKVLDFDFADKPAIESRSGGWYATYSDAYFAAKWRTFASMGNMIFNEQVWYYYPHALYKIVNPLTYGDAHPDWFSSNKGQPCYSSEGFRTQLIKGIKNIILTQPSIIYIPLGPEDQDNSTCKCKDCLIEQELYTYSGQVVRWINSVVEELEAWRIEQGIERVIYYPMLAYYETKRPPLDPVAGKDVFKPIDESCILNELSPVIYAPIEANFGRYLDDPEHNKAAMNDLKGWLACSKSFMAYYYNNDFFRRFEWNYVSIETTVHNYALAADYGAIHLGDDASNAALQACAFQTMRGYIYAKAQWDPYDIDVNELIHNYINNYYKDAKEEVLEYYYLMETTRASVIQANDKINVSTEEKDWMTKGLLERAVQLLRKGIQDIKNNKNYTEQEREKYITRVELELLTPLVAILENFHVEYSKSTYLAIVDEMEYYVNKYALIITATYSYSKTNEEKFTEWRKNKQ